ncbi:MAG: MMPL family transporter [Alphaproteobacteria bacterium]|nr:MMPL family transporter [Alphaproteobacteria bacterium]
MIARLVGASCDRAAIVVALGVLLGVLAAVYTERHFAMTTDTLTLMSPDLAWRRNKAVFDAAFPQQSDLIVAVVDGATPELAETGAAALAAQLAARSDLFRSVRRPDAGPFLERYGILLLPVADVAAATKQLIAAQSFLGPLAADPSLRGVMDSLRNVLMAVGQGQAKLGDFGGALGALAGPLEQVVQGKPAFFSWQAMISGEAGLRQTRRIVLLQPKLDNSVLTPGGPARDAIRAATRDLHLDAEHGVRVRLTGSVLLADDEFATLTQHVVPMTAAMIAGVLLMLWCAVGSVRIIACIIATTLLGLVLASGLGLLVVGRFNLISVAFIPLFTGLGIDFAIQFGVRYRAERVVHPELKQALTAAGATVGISLAVAGAAIAAGFFAFIPTDYLGASELGLIAGMGMIIAFLLSITLMPALLTLVRPPGEKEAVGFAALAPLDRFFLRRRRRVFVIAGIAAVLGLALLPLLRFDFNPLDLRSPKVESVSTMMDLLADPDRTPNTIDVLAPTLAAAEALAKRLSALPEVARAVTLSSFVPGNQKEKLALLGDAASLLDLVLDPIDVRPAPSDAETVQSLSETVEALRHAAGSATAARANGPEVEAAGRLAVALATLAAATPEVRARASQTLIAPLTLLLARLRTMLEAGPVTLQTLPPDLVRDWVTPDGRARIQVAPQGDSNDNRTLQRFTQAVRAVAPDVTGVPISIQEAATTVVGAFIRAGIWSFLAITILLAVVFRRARDVILTLIPILLTGLLTLASCVIIDQPLNFANIIALPLLFGIGVAFNIYFVIAWRAGETDFLQSSLARAVLFSALTTGTAFGSLWLSAHPGTASMGLLLMISLGWTLVTTLLFEPALLGPPPAEKSPER